MNDIRRGIPDLDVAWTRTLQSGWRPRIRCSVSARLVPFPPLILLYDVFTVLVVGVASHGLGYVVPWR